MALTSDPTSQIKGDGTNSVAGQLVKTYTTFSGVDITAMFDDMTMHTLQGIAISITREKVPVYKLGSARPVSVSRGKRGIAGTLQFVLFDRSAMDQLIRDKDHYYYAHADEVNWLTDTFNPANRFAEAFAASTTEADYSYDATTGQARASDNVYLSGSGDTQRTVATSIKRVAEYMDQCYPFDVTLVAQNEYGNSAWSAVIGLEIINEGGGISMDDLTNEQTATYIAIHRQPWTPVNVDKTKDWYSVSNVGLSDNTIDTVKTGVK